MGHTPTSGMDSQAVAKICQMVLIFMSSTKKVEQLQRDGFTSIDNTNKKEKTFA
jgi:hypothetical protein